MIVLRVLRPASREQLSKLFHVEKLGGNGKVFIGKFWAKKNPPISRGVRRVRLLDLDTGCFKVGLDAFKQGLDFIVVP
jgi:hypothetical protein